MLSEEYCFVTTAVFLDSPRKPSPTVSNACLLIMKGWMNPRLCSSFHWLFTVYDMITSRCWYWQNSSHNARKGRSQWTGAENLTVSVSQTTGKGGEQRNWVASASQALALLLSDCKVGHIIYLSNLNLVYELIIIPTFGQAWLHTPSIPALGRQKQVYLWEFKANLVYLVSSKTARPVKKDPS